MFRYVFFNHILAAQQNALYLRIIILQNTSSLRIDKASYSVSISTYFKVV